MLVQIYEIQTPAEAEAMIRLGVDHIGSVVLDAAGWKNSRIRETVRASQDCGAKSSLIPLFSDVDLILKALDYYRPDLIHFCETLSDPAGILATCGKTRDGQAKVREAFPGIAVMRSIPIAPPGMASRVQTLELAAIFESSSDYFLTDTMMLNGSAAAQSADSQPVAGFIGITGRTCDWDMARRLVQFSRIPVILAGGISPSNVMDGIRKVRPHGVDSCSGTNAVDGLGNPVRFCKDPGKVRRLVEIVRRAETTAPPPSCRQLRLRP
jgi:phosphoribosylanthranilate isomerase